MLLNSHEALPAATLVPTGAHKEVCRLIEADRAGMLGMLGMGHFGRLLLRGFEMVQGATDLLEDDLGLERGVELPDLSYC